MPNCTCGHIMLGSERTEERNWNPDCPEHGTTSVWWSSPAQVERRRYDSARLRTIQVIARLRRQEKLDAESARSLLDAIDGTGRWSAR